MQPSFSTAFDTPTSTTDSFNGGLTSYSSSPPQFTPNTFTAINRRPNMESSVKNIPSSLISPPEATPYESFSRSSPAPTVAPSKESYQKFNQFPSPPVSPEQKISGPEESTSLNVKDPILYPNQDHSSIASTQPPLFADADQDVTHRLVDEHMSARAQHQFREASPPRRDDYYLALEFKSQVAKLASQNTRKWFQREREFLLEDQRRQSAHKHLPKIAPAPHARNHISQASRVVKVSAPKVRAVATPRKPRPAVSRNYGSATPEPKRMHAGTTTREDRDFNSLPDFSPPISTLPNRPNSLKVEWKGAPIDLRGDPFRHLLHDDEVALAANLRLDCATYLTSKRRIFIARIECLRIGKEFRKTDSQQACKIDVNKASKLWTAFEKVGWLKKEHFINLV